MPIPVFLPVLLSGAAGLLQLCTSWVVKVFAVAVIAVLAKDRLFGSTAEGQHQKEHKAVSEEHAKRMDAYKPIKPMNRPPMSVYTVLAASHGVLDSLVEASPDFSPHHPVKYSAAPAAATSDAAIASSSVHTQPRTCIQNKSSVVLHLACQEIPNFKEYVAAMDTYTLPQHLPAMATLTMGGYKTRKRYVEFTANIDQQLTLGILVSEDDDQVHFACQARN